MLDGGSTDDTTAVIESFQARHPNLRYERRDQRGGIDRDMARAVGLGRGEYCWIFCADDVMRPGSIRRMLANLESGADVYLCGLTLATFDMQPMEDHRVARIKTEAQFDLGRERDRRRYFRRAQTTTAFFSFAGSIVIRKSRWDAVPLDEEFVGSLWAHVARIFQMIPQGLRLHYVPTSYLLKRQGNDSFMDKGIVHRYAVAIDGYHRLASACFPAGGFEARHIHRVLTNEFPPWGLLGLKFTCEVDRPHEVAEIDRLAAKAYGDGTLRNRAYRLFYNRMPRWAFTALQPAYRAARSIDARLRTRRPPEPQEAER